MSIPPLGISTPTTPLVSRYSAPVVESFDASGGAALPQARADVSESSSSPTPKEEAKKPSLMGSLFGWMGLGGAVPLALVDLAFFDNSIKAARANAGIKGFWPTVKSVWNTQAGKEALQQKMALTVGLGVLFGLGSYLWDVHKSKSAS